MVLINFKIREWGLISSTKHLRVTANRSISLYRYVLEVYFNTEHCRELLRYLKVHNMGVFQGGREHWTGNCTGAQTCITTVSYSLAKKLWVLLSNFDWLVSKFWTNNLDFQLIFCLSSLGKYTNLSSIVLSPKIPGII